MAIAFLLLGLFMLYQSTRLSMRGMDGGPGPGLLPMGLSILMIALSARLAPESLRERPTVGNVTRIGVMLAIGALYALVLESIGFVIATAAMMVALLVAFNERNRAALALLGIVGTVVTYHVFHNVLKVQLPADPWGVWR